MTGFKIARAWIVGFVLALIFVTIRIVIPYLVNLHNDYTLVLAFLWAGGIATVVYLAYHFLFNDKDLNDE